MWRIDRQKRKERKKKERKRTRKKTRVREAWSGTSEHFVLKVTIQLNIEHNY